MPSYILGASTWPDFGEMRGEAAVSAPLPDSKHPLWDPKHPIWHDHVNLALIVTLVAVVGLILVIVRRP